MPAKSDTPKKAAASKAKAAAPKHAPFLDMIKDSILNLKERNGSSRQAIKKYIQANNNLGGLSDSAFSNHISRALSTGEENGLFERPKGPSGPVKLKKAAPKPVAEKKETKPVAEKKAPAAKKAATKKAPAAKKAPTKKTTATTKKAAPAAKPKANASKPRAKKAAVPAVAPAVGEEKSVVLGKTKSGRVTKSKAPQAAKSAAKKTGATKKAATKKATPKKSATPKKVES